MPINHWRLCQMLSLPIAALLATLVPSSVAQWQPHWITLVLVFWASTRPGDAGFGMAWAFGLMADLMSGSWAGVHVASYCVIVFLCTRWHSVIQLADAMQRLVMLGLLLGFHLGYLQVLSILIDAVNPGLTHWTSLATSLLVWPLLNALLSQLVSRPAADH